MQPRLKALLICDKVPHQVCDESYKQHDESDGEVACVVMHSNLKWKRLVHALLRMFEFRSQADLFPVGRVTHPDSYAHRYVLPLCCSQLSCRAHHTIPHPNDAPPPRGCCHHAQEEELQAVAAFGGAQSLDGSRRVEKLKIYYWKWLCNEYIVKKGPHSRRTGAHWANSLMSCGRSSDVISTERG
jgi:hypothetical protein